MQEREVIETVFRYFMFQLMAMAKVIPYEGWIMLGKQDVIHETAMVLLDNGNRIFHLLGFDSYRLIYCRRNAFDIIRRIERNFFLKKMVFVSKLNSFVIFVGMECSILNFRNSAHF